jgi:hypothetical protein
MQPRAKTLSWLGISFGGVVLLLVAVIGLQFYQTIRSPFRSTELAQKATREFANSKSKRMRSIIEADAFCFLGVGSDPTAFARQNFPTFVSAVDKGDGDPLFLRSDSHWHLLVLDMRKRSYEVVPISIGEITLANEDLSQCAADFVLTSSRNVSDRGGWVLEVLGAYQQ